MIKSNDSFTDLPTRCLIAIHNKGTVHISPPIYIINNKVELILKYRFNNHQMRMPQMTCVSGIIVENKSNVEASSNY